MLGKCKSQGAGKAKVMILCLGKEKSSENHAHRSARHIDAERTAAVMNVPNEDSRRAGKRTCSPVKEL